MKKIVFFAFTGPDTTCNGINRKVLWQTKAFEKHGLNVYRTAFDCIEGIVYIFFKDKIIIKERLPKLFNFPFIKNIFAAFVMFWLAGKIIQKNNIKNVYVRKSSYIELLLSFLVKWKFPKLKIFMEIPTYPYKEEFGYNLKGLSRRFLDMAFVQLFKNHVDRFITYSTHQKINGVEAIQTGNGYSFESIEPIIKNKKNNFIVFTTVACFQRWHGIDRFISSLKLYRKPGVIFNVVGNGSALPALKEMVNKDDYLKKIVIFHGFLSFENMKKIYEKTDIAVGCLGCHRKNIGQIQPLKNREYIAMGLPLIFSTKDRLVPWHLPFVYKIKDDESLFDIEDIIRWYKNGCFDSRKIYEYGKKNLSWYKQLEIVVENFQ